jgi:hypothetical protein
MSVREVTFLLEVPIAENRVNDGHTTHIVVFRIMGVDESIRDVWNIVSAVAFARDVNLFALCLEVINEVLVESHKLFRKTNLVHNVRSPLRESNAHRLFHPKHIRQVHPGVRVLRWGEGSRLPGEGTVFQEKPAEGAAAGAAVEPSEEDSVRRMEAHMGYLLTR